MTYRMVTLPRSAREIIIFACPLKASFGSWKVFLEVFSQVIRADRLTLGNSRRVPIFQQKNFITVHHGYIWGWTNFSEWCLARNHAFLTHNHAHYSLKNILTIRGSLCSTHRFYNLAQDLMKKFTAEYNAIFHS